MKSSTWYLYAMACFINCLCCNMVLEDVIGSIALVFKF